MTGCASRSCIGRWSAVVGLIILVTACGSSHVKAAGDATATLRAAANATANAQSFIASVPAATATYQAPDHFLQVEHGLASSGSATNGGAASSSGPYPSTITKLVIGDQYYEGDPRNGQSPTTFTVSTRCPTGLTLGEAMVQMLKAVASDAQATTSGDDYNFVLPQPPSSGLPTSGTATLKDGYVSGLSFAGTALGTVTIDSVNSAPPVTAPSSATPANVTC